MIIYWDKDHRYYTHQ